MAADSLSPIPTLVFREHILRWLDCDDRRCLRLVNRQFAELYNLTAQDLTICMCGEALRALRGHTVGPFAPSGDCGPCSSATSPSDHATETAAPTALQLRYPSVRYVTLACDAGPLSPFTCVTDAVELLTHLGPRPHQTALVLLDAETMPLLRGFSMPASSPQLTARPPGNPPSSSGARAGMPPPAALARTLADILPGLQGIRFGRGRHDLSSQAKYTCTPAAARPLKGLLSWNPPNAAEPEGAPNRDASRTGGAPAQPSILSPQLFLQTLAAELLRGSDGAGSAPCAPRSNTHLDAGGGSGDVTSGTPHAARQPAAGWQSPTVSPALGLQSLCIDYSIPSADPFEAELLDAHVRHLPALQLDFRPIAAAAAAATSAAAAHHHPILPPPVATRPALPHGPAYEPSALLRLVQLELRGVTVAPGLLAGLAELRQLTRLVLSVSCSRPYEPLVTALPALRQLRSLHLFLHVPSAALVTQLRRQQGEGREEGRARERGPAREGAGPPARGELGWKGGQGGVGSAAGLPAQPNGSVVWSSGARGDVDSGTTAYRGKSGPGGAHTVEDITEPPEENAAEGLLEEEVAEAAPDCSASQLAAAISQCSRLVSLGLPGEDLDGLAVPALLQALPGLTHLEACQLGSWELAAPHTALRSLVLTMTWPHLIAELLPNLPRLAALRADMYVHTSGSASQTGAAAGSRSGANSKKVRHRDDRVPGRARDGVRHGTTHRGRGSGGGRWAGDDGDGGGGGDVGGAGVEELYEQLAAAAASLADVRHVELQLSVMRREAWDWALVLRHVAAVGGLRGLTLRMPLPDSGPPLRSQHLVAACRSMRALRRLTLLLAPGCSEKLGAKSLQALEYLPHLELVQLHTSGVWDRGRAPEPQGRAVQAGNGRSSGRRHGQAGADTSAAPAARTTRATVGDAATGGRRSAVGGDAGAGGSNAGARNPTSRAVIGCTQEDANGRGGADVRGRQRRNGKGGRGQTLGERPDNARRGMTPQEDPSGGDVADQEGRDIGSPAGPGRVGSGAAKAEAPPLPAGCAAMGLLEAARSLGSRLRRRGAARGRRRPARVGASSTSTSSSSSDEDCFDSATTSEEGTEHEEGAEEGSSPDSARQGGRTRRVAELAEDADEEEDGIHGAGQSRRRGGVVSSAGGSGYHGSVGGAGDRQVTTAAPEVNMGAAVPPLVVRLQVDFLTEQEVAELNGVLRWERVPVVVRAGLEPGWVWAAFAGLGN